MTLPILFLKCSILSKDHMSSPYACHDFALTNYANSDVHHIHSKSFLKKSPFLVAFLFTASFAVLMSLSSHSILSIENTKAAVDIDTEGDGRAAAYDGEEGITTDGDSFCNITEDIAGGKFSSLFEGVVDCGNDSSQVPNQLLVEYSYTRNPVKIGEKTYLTITVKDKNTGNPISNAFVTLAIEDAPSSLRGNIVSTGLAAAAALTTTSAQEDDVQVKTTQTTHTDNNGQATFTVQLGPNSDVGIYDTEIEITKDNYQSSFQNTNLRVV